MSLAAPATPFPFIHASAKRRKNVWYTTGSGNWTDPNIWMCNALTPTPNLPNQYPGQGTATYVFPRVGDDVYIGLGHTVTFDTVAASTTTLNNFYVAGTFLLNNNITRTLNVLGDIQATGTVNLTINTAFSLALFGVNNTINTLVAGTNASITYARLGDQPIMNLPYWHLGINGSGTKYLTANTTVAGNYNASGIGGGSSAVLNQLECSIYNLTVNGASSWGAPISKTGTGNLLFVGLVTIGNNSKYSADQPYQFSFTGNPTVEFRGGITTTNIGSGTNTDETGTGTWRFTTNSQTISGGNGGTTIFRFNCPISVENGIALTFTSSTATNAAYYLNKPIDNTLSGGSVINKTQIYFNDIASLPSFTTGTFDRTSFANTVGYTMPASITLPYTNYWSLLVSNSGTKVPSGNTTLLGNLLVNNAVSAAGTFDIATYDLTVTGTTTPSVGTLKKTGAGNILFIGALTPTLASPATMVDFRTGNPNVELRGGMQTDFNVNTFYSGTGTWTFTTNNQNIVGFGQVWNAPVVVAGAITVTLAHQSGNNTAMQIPSLNGTVSTSKFLIGGTGASILYFTTSTVQMPTGIFDHATNVHTIGWNFDGDYTLPYTTFNGGLFIGGTGTKTAAADVVLSGNLGITTTSGTFELGTFNLSVGGTTTINSTLGNTNVYLSKTGAGSILFGGQLVFSGNNPSLSLTGNPTVECRGGINFSISGGVYVFSGSPTFTFTTNNQSITSVSSAYNFPYNILISGAITLTNGTANNGLRLTGTINGNNAASTFDNRGRIEYQNAQQPMLTGVLQTNLAANTFIYNAAGNQDVKGGTYRTLQLAGSGVKTLQGNVVVATSYTLTPPATLNLNGFTRS